MAYPKFGLYQAVVTDNSEFYKRGYIRVRISAFFNGSVEWDLAKSYDETKFKKALKDDFRCLVYMPIGGGNGHGMFSLPQVNSVGLVSFIDGNIKKAVWMGSFVNPKFDEDGKFYEANVPADVIDKEGKDSCGLTVDGKNVDVSGGAIIIRQKSTKSGDAESMNWDMNRTENLIVMDKDLLKINHVTEWKEKEDKLKPTQYQEISIKKNTDETSENNGIVTLNIKTYIANDDNTIDEYGIEIMEKEVSIVTNNNKSKTKNTILINQDAVKMKSNNYNDNKSTEISLTPNQAEVRSKDSVVSVTEKEVNISGTDKLTLSGKSVLLGGLAEEYVVTSNIPFSFRMEDGTVLSSSNIAKA